MIVLQVQSEFTNLYKDFLRFSKLMPQFKGLDVMIARVKLLAIFWCMRLKVNQLVVSSSCLGKAYGSDLSEAVRKRGNTDPVGHL